MGTPGKVNRSVLSSYYQNAGQVYDDTKTEGAFETVAQQVDDNWDYLSSVESAGKLVEASVYNVKSYGAKGDGITDDTAAILAAIAVCGVKGGKVEFPAGVFRITSDMVLSVSTKPIVFSGKGWSYDNGATTRILVDSAISAFTIQDGSNGHTFENINFYGSNVGLKAINGPYGNKTRVFNCLVERFIDGIYLQQGLCHIKDSFIRNCTGVGVTMHSDSWMHETEITVSGVGLRLTGGGSRIHDNLINSCTSYGVHIVGTTISNAINDIHDNYLGESGTWNIYLESVAGNINTTMLHHNYIQQVENINGGFIKAINCRNLIISNTQILGGGNGAYKQDKEGIYLENCQYCQINGLNSQFTTREDILLYNCEDCSISDVNVYNHGNASTPSASLYSIRSISGSRNKIHDISLTDTRGGSGYSKGIEVTSSLTTVIDYSNYGSFMTDSFASDTRVIKYNGDVIQVGKSSFIENLFYFANGVAIFTGTGTPEGAVSAGIGSLFLRADGGAGTTLYVKQSGNFTTTGWVAK